MAYAAGKSSPFIFLILNLILYLIVIIISAWEVNHGMEKASDTASVITLPARIFPIYFPLGNTATGFVVIFALIAGVVGFMSSMTGVNNVLQWNAANLHAAAAASFATWALTLLAMGFAWKEINMGWVNSNMRALEIILMVLSGTQLLCTWAIHAGIEDVDARDRRFGGRV